MGDINVSFRITTELKELPKVGETYNYFDDGKISKYRLYTTKILEIIKYDDIDKDTLDLFKEEAGCCYWLYAYETDYFIKAELDVEEETKEEIFFVRTKGGEWFSLGFWAGLLDIDGGIYENMIKESGKYEKLKQLIIIK